jgi:protein arginine N-methyltransferase 5
MSDSNINSDASNDEESDSRSCSYPLPNTDKKPRIVLMVLGAGRGPLVDAALNASQSTGIDIKIYAIEKNPHAIIILQNKCKYFWKEKNVTVVDHDMRTWAFPEKAHIIVSELLGSFGDNELSPECLDGGQRVLRNDGICIPQSYACYLAPVSDFNIYQTLTVRPKDFETPYIINLQRFQRLSADIQKCWAFEHPLPASGICSNNCHNRRYCKLTFDVNVRQSMLHGFIGYFDTKLYKDISLSIHPATFSTGMFSWFPIFFPVLNPIAVTMNEKVTVHMWRKVDKQGVWYEWSLTSPTLTQIHNPNHRSYHVRL